MAEVKNSFLASKMNKDLDDRLVPNSQYRDALNISVGKSESDNIGVLQNVLGNVLLTKPDGGGVVEFETNDNLTCIGYVFDNQNNRVFQFLTEYVDPNPSLITLPPATAEMKITMYDPSSSVPYRELVRGPFLNFSKTNLIIGVNIIEDLLFFTDNRNQPRKINIQSAINDPNYYYNETQISVAKYAPIEPISLIKRANANVDTVISTTEFNITPTYGTIIPGMTVLSSGGPVITGDDYMIVKDVTITDGVVTAIELYQAPPSPILIGSKLIFLASTMTNKSDLTTWPGDPAFLEDKFARFSYRFKFDDNEYSVLAPFTQIAYIPKQKGYFINGDESAAYRSTVVEWMENGINNIELIIPLPDKGTNLINSYKIAKIDILYKESDSNEIKVIDSIPYNAFTDDNTYSYNYQSQKPYKTLTPDQLVRVYDNVPVRALAQEISGNRVMYGNFSTTYTPPETINYNTTVNPKQSIFDNFIEYPNHTLKQNRNYQVGFILSDKFGRSSSVILSSFDSSIATPGATSLSLGGSTIYAPYQKNDEANFPNTREWFGNALAVLVNTPITSTRSIPNGTPGLYANPTSTNGFSIIAGETINIPSSGGGYEYTFTLDTTLGILNDIPAIGNYLRGKYIDYTKIIQPVTGSGSGPYVVITENEINDLYLFDTSLGSSPNTKYVYNINEIGWYSYKVVVKQQQQDYYNVYLPGMLKGYPAGQTYGSQVVYTGEGASTITTLENGINITDFPVGEVEKTSHIVLINDNINKVPRDLSDVGPDQKQYRSSVLLFGKVENKPAITTIQPKAGTILNNPYSNVLQYVVADYPLAKKQIKIGDGVQCREANIPIPNPDYAGTTLPNPDRWLANTVVTSHTISPDGLTGIITFSPGNWTRTGVGTYNSQNFDFTRAENSQYFSTRKGDTVTAIASADEFNFTANGVENIKGTAAINFYQLQTKPLIGRISTVNSIGVLAESMIPFLSVYETSPDVSALALFWETASVGYISDLNWDVVTGFDGPSRFSEFDFIFWEDQNYDGADPTTGAANSKYITDEWKILNSTGIPLFPDSVTLYNVSTGLNPDVTSSFGIELVSGTTNEYRLYIRNNFLFNNEADLNSDFTFTIQVTIGSDSYQLPITGRLGNREPYFLQGPEDYATTVEQVVGPVVAITAENGSSLAGSKLVGLCWDFISGNSGGYFSIDSQSGLINLIDSSIPIGIYDLHVRVRDAVDFTNPLVPEPLVNSTYPQYATKQATILVRITIGPKKVNDFLAYYDTGTEWIYGVAPVLNNPDASPTYCTSVPGQGYGAVYIGAQNITLDSNGYSPDLPPSGAVINTGPGGTGPTVVGGYQKFVNVQVANGASFGTVAPPTGLTQGELEFTIKNYVNGFRGSSKQNRIKFILYWRESMFAPNNTWEAIYDENGNIEANIQYNDFDLTVDNPIWGNAEGARSTKIVSGILGEYCLVVKNYQYLDSYVEAEDPETLTCNIGDWAGAQVIVKDANYNYAGTEPNPGPPIVEVTEYLVGCREYNPSDPSLGYPSGIPYDTQNATIGFNDTVLASPTGGALADPNELVLTETNFQLVNGLSYKPTVWEQADAGFPYTASSSGQIITLSGTGVNVGTYGLVLGMKMINVSGTGTFAANTVVSEIISNTQFRVSITPTVALSGAKIKGDNNWLGGFTSPNSSKIADVSSDGLTLVLSWEPTIVVPAGIGALVPFGTVQNPEPYQTPLTNGFQGSVYAAVGNPLHVNQFYIDSGLTTIWEPPVADKFYVFQNKPTNFNVVNRANWFGTQYGLRDITTHPLFCAKFNAIGQVIDLPSPENTIMTAWGYAVGTYPVVSPNITLVNKGYNLYQDISLPPIP